MKWKKYLFTVISVAHDRTSSLVSDTQDDAQDSSWGGHGFHLQGAGERRARVLVQLERARDAHSPPGAFHFAARLPWAQRHRQLEGSHVQRRLRAVQAEPSSRTRTAWRITDTEHTTRRPARSAPLTAAASAYKYPP